MKIIFSEEQTRTIHELASRQMVAEVEEAMEPSGYTLRVEVGNAVYGYEAHMEIGGRSICLGDVEIE